MKNNKTYWILTAGVCIILVVALMMGYRAVHKTVEVDEPVEVAENEVILENGVPIIEDAPSEATELPESNEKKSKKKNTPVVKSEPVEEPVATDKPVVNEEPIVNDGNTETEESLVEIKDTTTPEEPKEREITGSLLGSDFKVTHYAPTGNATASGRMPEVGVTVAVDKKLIKFGTRLRIEIPDGNGGYKVYQDNCRADDTGGLIKGHKIDVFVASESEARQRGVIRNARVYIYE